MSPFMWVKPLANTDFYQEHILHLAMHNPQGMLYFNRKFARFVAVMSACVMWCVVCLLCVFVRVCVCVCVCLYIRSLCT